ncbi:craniofacial development protein 2-like [Penaeus japonicus]|uniref:craniofacial development protein 2-like n=1 Tax=Penaeus japonicus TaxID=27405 RepID=UPI001C716C58|nr:craniofacial development protein 2-like [Penaeus japonicus]
MDTSCGTAVPRKNILRGVGVLVEKETAKSVIECTPVSDRIIAIRLKGKPRNMTIIQIYAPTSDSEDEEIERFYQDLEQTIKEKAKKDILIIQGDWNAKIGYKESTGWEGTIGDFGVGTRNERGIMLLEFAKRHHLVVANTLHNHKLSRRTTWHSPDGVTHNQIDYILVNRRFQTGINRPKTRTLKKTDIGSDHDPVMMTFRMRLSKEKKVSQRRTKFDLEKLKDREVAEKYRSELAGRFAPLLLLTNEEPQQLCDQFTDITFNTANEIIEDKTGQLLTNNTEVTARWKEYCRELYQHQADVDRTVLAEATSEGEPEPVILESEVRAAIIKLKMNKAPGYDNLPAELIKCGGDPIIKTLHLLCNRILQIDKWPTQLTQSILIPIPKKENE